jgi:hypothetical protein
MTGFRRTTGWTMVGVALGIPLALGVAGCGQDEVVTVGTNTLTVEVTNLVGADGSQLAAELTKNVDYGQTAPTWQMFGSDVTASPFSASATLERLPEGEFGLTLNAGVAGDSQKEQVKGQGCEMSFVLGKDETVTIRIDGLNAFGDKGYGDCRATTVRS